MNTDDKGRPNEASRPDHDQSADQQWPQKPAWPARPVKSDGVNTHTQRERGRAASGADAPTKPDDSSNSGNSVMPGYPAGAPERATLDQTAPYRTAPRKSEAREVSEEPTLDRTAPYKPVKQVKTTRKSNLPLVLGIVALVLAVAVAVAAYWAWNNVINKPSVPVGRLLPTDTLAYLSIDPSLDNDQKAAFTKLRSTFEADPAFKDAWANVVRSADRFTQDISQRSQGDCKKMLNVDEVSNYVGGNLTLAVLPPSTADLDRLKASPLGIGDIADVAGRNLVAIVDLDFNPLNKKGPIADLKRQADDLRNAELVEEYLGVEIRKLNTCEATAYFSLLSGTATAIISPRAELLRTVIDNYKGESNLGAADWYMALMAQVPKERAGTLFLNLTHLYMRAEQVAPDRINTRLVPTVGGAWMIALTAEEDGVQIDLAAQASVVGVDRLTGRELNIAGIAGTAGTQLAHPGPKPDVNMLYSAPKDSLAFIVGSDLKLPLQELLYAQRQRDYDTTVSLEHRLKDQTGLNLQGDIFSMLTGDYVISATPYDPQENSFPPTTFQFRLKPDQRGKVADALPKVLKAADDGEEPQKLKMAGGVYYKRLGSLRVFAGVVSEWLIVVVDHAPVPGRDRMAGAVNNLGKGIGGTDEWKYLSRHLPSESNVIGYVRMEAARSVIEGSLPPERKSEYEKNVLPLLRPFKSIVVGSTTQPISVADMRRNHTRIFLSLDR